LTRKTGQPHRNWQHTTVIGSRRARWGILFFQPSHAAMESLEFANLVLLFAAVLSVASVLYTRARLEFHTGQDDLITPNSRASRDYLNYTREFPDLDGLIIVVRAAPDPTRAEHFVDALAARLNADHANVKTVFYKIDAGAFADRAMLYMKSSDLDALAQKIRAAFPMLHAYAADPSLAGFFAMVNSGIDRQMQIQMRRRRRRIR
jgi:predicted RND superfamily exporter protein